jgi:hypothetical protein
MCCKFQSCAWLIVIATWPAALVIGADTAAKPPGTRATVVLTSQEPDKSEGTTNAKLLVREIARQAVLIAARDELGLPTRDMTLRETVLADDKTLPPLDLQITEKNKAFVRVQLSQGSGDEKRMLFEKAIALRPMPQGVFDYYGYLSAIEELSRTELVEALKRAGFDGKADLLEPSVVVKTMTQTQLNQMNIFSQFAALRELHSLQRRDGQSAQTLSALVRGYANLGQMTSFHWNAAHKAFKARSLL